MNLKILTLNEYSLLDFINLLNKVFQDYTVPIKWDVVTFKMDIRENSISLSDSFIFLKDNKPFGFIVVSIRKDRARIDAMGVIKEERGTGAASYILEHTINYLKWRRIKNIQLEVIKSDKRAYRFYEKHGFREKRQLFSMILKDIRSLDIEYKKQKIEPRTAYTTALDIFFSGRKPNWQREPVTLLLSDGRYNFEKIITKNSEGYLVWNRELDSNKVYIIDLGTKDNWDDITKASIKYLKDTTGCDTILVSSVPENDMLYNALKNNNFETFLIQSEMTKEVI
ncbi:MAG: GNAT family N-acetyltransferase [Thermosipho sp. (in: Bacteria)]|nr:GNAT family N-acetyltransferase [Thermosipho sp. (in: thermotogales)]